MKIAYKITNAVAVLATIPALLLLPLFRFIAVVDMASDKGILSAIGGLLGNVLGDNMNINSIIEKFTGINIEKLPEFYTVFDLYDMFADEQAAEAFAGFDMSVIPEQMKTFLIVAAILILVSVFFAFMTMFTGFFAKKITVPIVTSVLAIGSAFGAKYFFGNVAQQLISGKIAITTILKGVPSLKSYSSLIDFIDFDIRILELSHAFTVFMVLLVLILLLNIGFRVALSLKDA